MDRIAPSLTLPNLEPILAALSRASSLERRLILKKQRYPRFLYKYRTLAPGDPNSVDRIREIVVRSRLWVSSPLDFNDPFDMSAKVVVEGSPTMKAARAKRLAKHATNRSPAERIQLAGTLMRQSNLETSRNAQLAHDNTLRKTGVCSFAGDPRSILMWSHYASHHTGVCLQFEVARNESALMLALRVDYVDDYPVINWLEDTTEPLKTVLLRKHTGWQYESERRIIIPGGAHTYLPFRSEALTGIILGCRSTKVTRRKVDELLIERVKLGLSVPTLYVATKHASKYALVIGR